MKAISLVAETPRAESLFQKQRLVLRRLLRYAKGLESLP